MLENEIKQEIKKQLVEILNLQIDPEDIKDDELLFEGTLGMDSIASISLIVALEKKFNITFEDEELDVDLFDSVNNVFKYVISKLQNN